MALAPGTILKGDHEYTIDSVLGQGGFGITYLASSFIMVGRIKQKAMFTIKEFFMKQSCSRAEDGSVVAGGDPAELKANLDDFMKEAEHLKAVKHPGVVAVNEIMKMNNTVYYVMEYLGDLSLGKYLKQKGTLPEAEAKLIVSTVGNALQTLHEKKMTHLDVKPDNIMLVDEGNGQFRPVLIDFGLSKHYNIFGSATSSLGAMGASNGYSPIEQYSGISEFSPTADVYALGATLFALLKGHAPKNAGDVTESYLRKELSDVSPQTQNAIVNAMKMAKGDRCQSVKEFMQQLGGAASEGPAASASAASQSSGSETVSLSMKRNSGGGSKKWIIIAVVALVVIGGVIGAFLAMGGSDDPVEDTPKDTTATKVEQKKDEVKPQTAQPAKTETTDKADQADKSSEKTDQTTTTPAKTEPAKTQQTTTQPAKSTTTTTTTTTAPKAPTSGNGTVNLTKIPAKYTGNLQNGQPYGNGSITFTRDYTSGDVQYSAGQTLGGTATASGVFMADDGNDIKIR